MSSRLLVGRYLRVPSAIADSAEGGAGAKRREDSDDPWVTIWTVATTESAGRLQCPLVVTPLLAGALRALAAGVHYMLKYPLPTGHSTFLLNC